MLSYHQSSDCFHTILRILCLLSDLPLKVELDKLYILDFYYAFPNYLKYIRVTPQDTSTRKALLKEYVLYSSETDPQRIFLEVNPVQKFAINALINAGFIINEDGKISIDSNQIPTSIKDTINSKKAKDNKLLYFITQNLNHFEILGKNGLKDRTHLMEYRYDDV